MRRTGGAAAAFVLWVASLSFASGLAVESGRFRYGAISWRKVGAANSTRVIISVER
jgi:hypothetical protein